MKPLVWVIIFAWPVLCQAAGLVLLRGTNDQLRIVKAEAGYLTACDSAIINDLAWPRVPYGSGNLAIANLPESGSGAMLIAKEEATISGPVEMSLFGRVIGRSYPVKYSCWIKPLVKTRRAVAVFIWHKSGRPDRLITSYLGGLDIRGYPVSFSTSLGDSDKGGAYSFHVFEIDRQNDKYFEYAISAPDET